MIKQKKLTKRQKKKLVPDEKIKNIVEDAMEELSYPVKILITGFNTFGVWKDNISKNVAIKLDEDFKKEWENGGTSNISSEHIIIPVSKDGIKSLRAYLRYEKPDMVFLLGQSNIISDFIAGTKLRIESSAKKPNYPDIMKESDFAMMVSLLSKIKLTDMAGTYYCNDAYYVSLSIIEKSCFFHIHPHADEEETKEDIKRAIKLAVDKLNKRITH